MREELMDLTADEENVTAPPLQPEQAKSNGDATAEATNNGVYPPAFSDDALALNFADRHADKLRYVVKWSWMLWSGTHWQSDGKLKHYDYARSICRQAAASCNSKFRKGLASNKTVAAVVQMARSDHRLVSTVEQWDADPWLLNTPDGVIDLRTGIMREHRAEDLITRITAVAPSKDACPLWRAFLDRVTGGDKVLQQYLQRVCGYALTGLTREHALFFLWGTGANGKGTFINAITGILADFHRTAPIETFTASNTDRHPTDLAGLMGARLVTANETEEGRRWAEAKVKNAHRRRQGHSPLHAARLLRLYAAVQADDRGQPQARPARGRRGNSPPIQPDPVHRHHPARGARSRSGREAQGRMARHPAMDDRWLPGLAEAGPCTAGGRHRGDRRLHGSARRHWRLDRRGVRKRPASQREGRRPVRIVESLGGSIGRIRRQHEDVQPKTDRPRLRSMAHG